MSQPPFPDDESEPAERTLVPIRRVRRRETIGLGPLLALVLVSWFLGSCTEPATPPARPSPRGWVTSASPEATAAGVRVLEAGGNAVDAAAAVSFALGVTEPAMSGLGGQTQMLLFVPGRGPLVINGTSFAPAATPRTATRDDLRGHRTTTVPATVRVVEYAWRRYGSGTVDWEALLQPAIEYAEDGFAIGPFRHKVLLRHHDDLQASESAAPLFLTTGGATPGVGQHWRQPRLAATLRQLATEGADTFYRGAIARAIADDMEEHGGWLSYADLAELPEPTELEPLRGRYRGHDVWTLPPPGGGWVVLRMLHGLDAIDADRLRPDSPEFRPLLAEVLRDGHRTREDRPVEDLLDYAAEVADRITRPDTGGETTHFAVVDASGLAVSATASINNYYGARAAHAELGFLYNDYMREFRVGDPDHPFAVAPGAMPYSSMSPTMLARDGRPVLVLGSPGSGRIISAIVQVIQRWVDAAEPIAVAVAAPRLHAPGDRRLFVEDAPPDGRLSAALADAGFELAMPAEDLSSAAGNPYFGGVHALAFEDGTWQAVADPRRDGTGVAARTR